METGYCFSQLQNINSYCNHTSIITSITIAVILMLFKMTF